MTTQNEQSVLNAEQQAMQAVSQAEVATAAQSTGYATATPYEAENIANNAVVAADQSVYQQAFDAPATSTPDEAEQQATRAVEATE
ncbi:hypothetical protein CBQ28_07995 [Pseudoalteromonas sp. GCY]|uniref:Uncharacterized protein n=1 Tax=Pseudoalteromonas piscicida TaxID=43662 RepID=A0AAQ2ERM7_PSEO7|nr:MULTISPECIES: hypothetical protein [Pseudoalteromonas]KJY91646.1 hypothetical protein TW75_04470 [Pseudoalteromonas piscicida]MDP4486912.1 hypothetical protein [Pseudoalteromonas piscicida]PHI37707.1 hypothetical protein CBQ28_07995 [Pseudoalteromonas sp. GCY]QQQ68697.1 hypothetical protein JJQ94_13310 [Pseudoalteromonas sp. GCY]TMN40234.1 hypothetical protein CWB94_09965 [Pseudoalteromonas piscicida]